MTARKMRVELFDSEGNRYTIVFEGQVTRDKALRLLDLVELLGGIPPNESNPSVPANVINADVSKFEKVRMCVLRDFPTIWFSSKDVQSAYEQEFKEPISLSTVATYLARMANKGHLLKAGASNKLKYRLASNLPPIVSSHKLP
jgi:hypothetical protein